MSGVVGLALGTLSGVALVGAAGPLQSRAERDVLGSWLTVTTALWRGSGLHPAPSSAVVVASLGLVLGWLLVAGSLHVRPLRSRRSLIALVAAWSAPFVLAVPVFSRDAYAYVAQGALLQQGLDPYRHPVAALVGRPSVLAAVDPVWRHTFTPYGPLGLRLEQLMAAVGSGQEWRSLLAVRVLACLGVAVTGWCIWAALPTSRRHLGLWLWLSPLVLVHLIGAGHLDAVVCAFLAGSMLAALREHPHWAVVLAVGAGEIKATAFLVLPVLLVQVLRRDGARSAARCGVTAGVVALAAAGLFISDPLGWVAGLSTPGLAWDPFTPASTVALGVSEVVTHLGGHPEEGLVAACRLTIAVVGVAVAAVLLYRLRRNGLVLTCGLLMLDLALTGPALWPWYLAPCLALLVMAASRAAWCAALVISSCGMLLALPLHVVPAQRVAGLAELVVLGTGVILGAVRIRVRATAWQR